MTKNRKAKQTIRAAQNAFGMNYTTARRFLDRKPSEWVHGEPGTHKTFHPIDHTPVPPAHPFSVTYGHTYTDTDLIPLTIDLGDSDSTPVTFISGGPGAGKSWAAGEIVKRFLAHNVDGAVHWLNPKRGDMPYLRFDDRVRFYLNPSNPDTLAVFTDLGKTTQDGPVLVIVEDLDWFLSNPNDDFIPSPVEFVDALISIARTGRSRNVRLLAVTQTAPTTELFPHDLLNAIGTRIWLARTTEHTWHTFFGPGHPVPHDLRTTRHALGWVQHHQGECPLPMSFRPEHE